MVLQRAGKSGFVSLFLALWLVVLVSGCGYGHRIAYHVFEGPLDAISIAHIAPDKILVLAGTVEDGKNVSIFYDSIYSEEVTRFPVSRYASAVRGGADGKFYLSIAGFMFRRTGVPKKWGALEEWNIDGQLLSTMRFPGQVVSMSKSDGSVIYALMATSRNSVAVGIRLNDGQSVGSVTLDGDTKTLDQCAFHGERYLLTSVPATKRVRLISTKTNAIVDTPMIATQPRCFSDLSTIVGIDSRPLGVDIALLKISPTDQRSEAIVAPPDTVEVEPSEDGRLFLLRRFGGDSNIQIWTHSEVANVAN